MYKQSFFSHIAILVQGHLQNYEDRRKKRRRRREKRASTKVVAEAVVVAAVTMAMAEEEEEVLQFPANARRSGGGTATQLDSSTLHLLKRRDDPNISLERYCSLTRWFFK